MSGQKDQKVTLSFTVPPDAVTEKHFPAIKKVVENALKEHFTSLKLDAAASKVKVDCCDK